LKSNFEVLSVPSRCFPGYPDNTPKFISLKPSHFAEGRFHRRDILPKVHFIEDTLHRSEKSILPKSISPKSVLPNGMNFSSKMIKTDLNGINFNKFNPKNFFYGHFKYFRQNVHSTKWTSAKWTSVKSSSEKWLGFGEIVSRNPF